jgi:hypothetical protein
MRGNAAGETKWWHVDAATIVGGTLCSKFEHFLERQTLEDTDRPTDNILIKHNTPQKIKLRIIHHHSIPHPTRNLNAC